MLSILIFGGKIELLIGGINEVKSIGTLYTGAKPSDLSDVDGLVGYWRFEKGSGTTVEDLSGNGNDGTFAPISGDPTALPTWSKDTP